MRTSVPALLAIAVALPASAAAEPSLETLFEKVSPAVVTIRSTVRKVESGAEYVKMEAGVSIGSGVVLHADGYIATAAHVVEQPSASTWSSRTARRSSPRSSRCRAPRTWRCSRCPRCPRAWRCPPWPTRTS